MRLERSMLGKAGRIRLASAGVLAGLGVLVVLAIAAPAQAASGTFQRAWGMNVDSFAVGAGFEICTVAARCQVGTQGGLSGELKNPRGVATDGAGNVYVADTDNQRIQKFDSAGHFQRAWGRNVDVDPDSTEAEICTVPLSCQAGTVGVEGGEFNDPTGVATDGAGNVYVADSDSDRIQKFDSSGNFQRAWGLNVDGVAVSTEFEICIVAASCQQGSVGVEGGEFALPTAVATDGAGNVYVTDANNQRIQRFDSSGNFQRTWGLNVDGVNVSTEFEICIVAANCQAGSQGGEGGWLNNPDGLATDGAGNVYVADKSNHRIQRFDSSGNFQRAWGRDVDTFAVGTGFEICTAAASCQGGTSGGGGGELNLPRSVATDGAGNVYVADSNNERIQRFGSAGNFQRAWGTNVDNIATGTGFEICTVAARCQQGTEGGLGGEFSDPIGVATDGAGNLYVADQANQRIQKFADPPPPALDTTAPVLSALTQSNRSWAVDSKGGAETQAARRKKKPKKGTTFSYRLSEAGRVVFTVERKTTGRKVKGKCVKQTRKNRKRPKCTLFKQAGSFAQQGRAGQNSKTFSGKVGSTKLKPGSYRATLVAKDAAGNASKPASLNFKVVRG